jgi:hypothetical protein
LLQSRRASRHLGRADFDGGDQVPGEVGRARGAASALQGTAGGFVEGHNFIRLHFTTDGSRRSRILISIDIGMPTTTSKAVQISKLSTAVFICIASLKTRRSATSPRRPGPMPWRAVGCGPLAQDVSNVRPGSSLDRGANYRHRGDGTWTNAPIVRPKATRVAQQN